MDHKHSLFPTSWFWLQFDQLHLFTATSNSEPTLSSHCLFWPFAVPPHLIKLLIEQYRLLLPLLPVFSLLGLFLFTSDFCHVGVKTHTWTLFIFNLTQMKLARSNIFHTSYLCWSPWIFSLHYNFLIQISIGKSISGFYRKAPMLTQVFTKFGSLCLLTPLCSYQLSSLVGFPFLEHICLSNTAPESCFFLHSSSTHALCLVH